MKKLLPFLLLTLLCIACDPDNDSPEPNPPTDSNWIDIKVTDTQSSSEAMEVNFHVIADKITIDWGDGTVETLQNVWDKTPEGMPEAINPKIVSHKYKDATVRNYNIRLSTEALSLFSAIDKSVSEIKVGESPYLTLLIIQNSDYPVSLNYKSEDTPNLDMLNLENIENITSLDLSQLPELSSLTVRSCKNLETLDISKNNKLKSITLYNNKLKELDLSNNSELLLFTCTDSELSSLDVTNNKKLQLIFCTYTNIEKLDLSKNKELIFLMLSNNKLTGEINLNNYESISSIDVSNNKITSVNISECPSLVSASFSNNEIDNNTFNSIFSNLPTCENGEIAINNNPGTNECDRSIATEKGWIFK